jgi:hypothetical protein
MTYIEFDVSNDIEQRLFNTYHADRSFDGVTYLVFLYTIIPNTIIEFNDALVILEKIHFSSEEDMVSFALKWT